MLTIKANIKTCVNDMTQQGKQALYEKYFSAGFTSETFEITVRLDPETIRVFRLKIAHTTINTTTTELIEYQLTSGSDGTGWDNFFTGRAYLTQHMTVLAGILCALHVCGDYIKFAFQPISVESEENNNA